MPALGTVRLERLTHVHVARLVADLEAAGRSAVTVRRIVATLSSAMSDAIKRRRLAHNPASHVTLPTVERTERGGSPHFFHVVEIVKSLTPSSLASSRLDQCVTPRR